ncbi:MAG: KH domain-containing protein [Oscillospiraceae bacterium]|nr:KH domain-containing protein [Oscillospiraceae bacterium]
MSNIKELITTIVEPLVRNKEAVRVEIAEPDGYGVTAYKLYVNKSDMGRVIGKKGRIAKVIRILVRAGAVKANEKVVLDINEIEQIA